MTISFFKYQGTGNDFIILDNRQDTISFISNTVKQLCDRRFGIGADGLMLLNKHNTYDFEMVYFNADGNESSMCGNGGRCIASFAKYLGLVERECSFIAVDGPHIATINNDCVKLKMSDVKSWEELASKLVVNTGSPHYVVETYEDMSDDEFVNKAKAVRFSEIYKQEGINVNFVQNIDETSIALRTYERGVENETLSCGTGAVAAALYKHLILNKSISSKQPIHIQTRGGILKVFFTKTEQGFEDIWLEGPTKFVFSGDINI